tara:strand:+ start:8283 stop:10151 length:1869 start_codon:yes stop_codon:yes gene_type:complete
MRNKDVLFFDVETNPVENFTNLNGLDKIHCISIYNPTLGRVITFSGDGITEGLHMLDKAGIIIGHNIIGFDVPALTKVFGWRPKGKVMDTLLLSRCVFPDIRALDMQNKKMPRELWGSHSLKAWGERMNFAKGSFGEEEEAFEEYCDAMKNYCERDVLVTHKLFSHLAEKKPSQEMIKIEHSFARVIRQQEIRGFGFDEEAALDLAEDLTLRRAEIRDELQELFPPVVEEMKTPSGWSVEYNGQTFEGETKAKLKAVLKEAGLKQSLANDAVKTGNKKKYIPFNPGSRDQIAKRLFEKYEWLPEQFTPDGRPKIDEAVLKSMKFPEAKVLCEYLMVSKRLGQLAEGKEAWIKVAKDGRIHGKVNTNGAVTGRCTHSGPNLAQVPATRAPYGERCRALFVPQDDYELVGVDASGLELRCLAHYLALWDGGEYGDFIVDGDVHTINQEAAGLETRDQAKTFIYAFLYGAGDAKIGDIVGGSAKDGAALKKRFLDQIPALARLKSAVETKAKAAGHLIGLDGRLLPIRSEHAALNTLLQSAGAVAMKNALVLTTQCLLRIGWKHGKEWAFVANVHDEFQAEVQWEGVEIYGKLAVDSIYQAGEYLGMKCPLDGEYKVGSSWAETH